MLAAFPSGYQACDVPSASAEPVAFWPNVFDTSDFPDRWHCGNWDARLGWLHIGADTATWLAYTCIPLLLIVLVGRRRLDLPVPGVLALFVAFILACGFTHLLDATMFWWPAYRALGLMKVVTAAISVATVVALVRVLPQLILLKSPAALEREVEARTTALRESEARRAEAQAVAERADRAKSRFLAHMSHELRTAMAAVLGSAELLEDETLGVDERRRCTAAVRRNTEHQLDLVCDVLDLSKIEAGALELNPTVTRPSEVVFRAVELVASAARDKGLELVVEDETSGGSLITDPLRLRQILVNLLSNAVKFTERGTVHVRITETQVGACRRVRFRVRDTGIGLTQEQTERIFDPYRQASAGTSMQYGGTGLGLCISRELARLLGGDLTASPREGQGAEFVVTIVGKAFDTPEPTPDRKRCVNLSGVRVLLVEDQRDIALVTRRHLEVAGCDVTHVDRGEAALAQMREAAFDLVLLDLQLPGMSGHETLEGLRARGWSGPVVALTANTFAEDRERCFAAGFDDFASKPLAKYGLLELVARHAARSGRATA